MKYKQMLEDAVNTDGIQFCMDALQEECAELIQAISHLRRGRADTQNMIKEMADVQIMLDMVRVGLDGCVGFNDFIREKSNKIGDHVRFKMERQNGEVDIHKGVEAEPRTQVGDCGHDEVSNGQ